MYSACSYQLTKEEFNYLLPVLRKKLLQRADKHFIITNNTDELEDALNRLKGLYDNYDDIKSMVVYKCHMSKSLAPFRNSLN